MTPPCVAQTCADCGGDFERRRDRLDTIPRCGECRVRARRRETWKVMTCDWCGTTFERERSAVAKAIAGGHKRTFCSRDCFLSAAPVGGPGKAASDRMSVERRGEGNPAYKSGKWANRARRSHFNLALKGEGSCRVCGRARHMGLHHAVPRDVSTTGRDAILNGLPLCASCHTSWHRRIKLDKASNITRDHFTRAEWDFVRSLITDDWLDRSYPAPDGAWTFRGEGE